MENTMPLAADTHIQLEANAPRQAATVGTGVITLGANEVAVKIGANISLANMQQIVGSLEKLFRLAKTAIANHTADTTWSMIPGGSDTSVVTTGHTDDLVSLYVDSAILTGNRSHFLDRTFKEVRSRLLEEAK